MILNFDLASGIILLTTCLMLLAGFAGVTVQAEDAEFIWHDLQSLKLEGQGWTDTEAPYDRLPARANGKVTEAVWNLSHHSAGMCVRFQTDAPRIQARWKLRNASLGMPHMPASGVSGLDLYVKMKNGTWRWLGAARPTDFPENTKELVSTLTAEMREYLLYLPLYNGVEQVEIGVAAGFQVLSAPDRDPAKQRPIVFYGTSITQGACASRPGMASTAIVGRKLDYPVINLGFSGNGRMEPEMAQLLTELDPVLYVIDCVPNLNATSIHERAEKFIQILRAARPETPILLSEGVNYSDAFLQNSHYETNRTSQAALREVYLKLVTGGVTSIYFMYSANQLGDDSEGTVDGIHATDLGFVRQAEAFVNQISSILPGAR